MKTQSFFRLFLIAYCLLLIPGYALSQEALKITHGPYLIEPAENAITVVWFTNKNCVSWIEYCGDDNFGTFPIWGGYPEIAKSSHDGLIDANTRKHIIRIRDLKPGKKYQYRVVSKEILQFDPYEVLFGNTVTGEVSQFETLDPNKTNFSFGVVADIHERGKILDTLLQSTDVEALDMMFLTGDILNWIGDEDRIFSGFLDVSVNHFAKEKPFIFIRGNHETRGPFARNLASYFPHSSGKFYYSFSQGNTRFIILDSGEDKPDSHPVYAGLVDFDSYRDKQTKWLEKEVQSEEFKKAKYKIVLFHIPPYTGSKKHGASDVSKKWGPVLNEANVDLVMSGHRHRYSKIDPQKGQNAFPVLVIGKDMIVKTDVSDKQLLLTITDKSGKLVDQFSITVKPLP